MNAPSNPGTTPAASGANVDQLGVYWPRSTWDLARSAYVADLDSDLDSPKAFVGWLARVIARHIARTPAVRAKIADHIPATAEGRGSSKGHRVGRAMIDALEIAIIDDRQYGRIVSRSAFVLEAVHVAGEEARARLGRPLPPPPAKLTNSPPRRRL